MLSNVLYFILALPLIAFAVWAVLRRHLFPYLFAFLSLKWELIRLRGTAVDMFERRVAKTPRGIAIIFEGRQLTWADLDRLANRVAHWAHSLSLPKNEVVALMMENRPEFIACWLWLAKMGIESALLNTNLRGEPLRHSLSVAGARTIIIGSECAAAVAEIAPSLPAGASVWCFTNPGDPKPSIPGFFDLNAALAMSSEQPPLRSQRANVTPSSLLFYIYTSGTTGLPKAARIKHNRFFAAGCSFAKFFGVRGSDRIYTPLPLYHSSAGMIGVSMSWYTGATMVLRRKFSSRQFFQDCYENKCTVIQYIGEVCAYAPFDVLSLAPTLESFVSGFPVSRVFAPFARARLSSCVDSGLKVDSFCSYLVATPPGPYDRQHQVRLAIGNGLREDVWRVSRPFGAYRSPCYALLDSHCQQKFQARFNIPFIGEFYGSTEGNCTMVNNQNKPGAIGYMPWESRYLYPLRIVKFDLLTEQPVRDKNGRCIEADVDEPGELIGMVVHNDPMRDFGGYTTEKATAAKIITDVFRKGDRYFRSGDLVRRDKEGFMYFVDRIGDTYRWKGENVSTNEVGKILSAFPGVKEANVYGVHVPGYDGRAGMAAIVPNSKDGSVDLPGLYQHIKHQLSSFQQPLFLRIQQEMEITSTFKHRKVEMVRQGFNPDTIRDPLFFRHDALGGFVPLTREIYADITAGRVRL